MIKRLLLSLALLTAFISAPAPAAALSLPPQATQFAACGAGLADYLGLEPWYGCLQKKYGSIKIGELNDIWLVVLPLLEDTIRAGAYIATGFIIWGGVKYLKSQGAPAETGQAKDIIRNAIIGLLWTILSVAIVEFITTGIMSGSVGGVE